jgi:hypothetical protein
MAKKSKAAFEFEFTADAIKKLAAKGTNVTFTAFIEQAETKTGEKVGVMRITAKAKSSGYTKGAQIKGGPIPPGGGN